MKKRIFAAICGVTLSSLFLALFALAAVLGGVYHETHIVNALLSLWWVYLLLFFAVGGVAYLFAHRITEPLNRIDPRQPPKRGFYKELAPLFERLGAQNKTIEKQLEDARHRQEQFRVLSENMGEGIMIVDHGGAVLSSNFAARSFLEMREANEELDDVLRRAVRGKHAEHTVTRDGHIYRLLGNPVYQNDRIAGAVVLILDETEKRSLEQYRREFTANVSHELKTPLTSISGFAELLENGMVAKEDVPDFAASIHTEAQRLLVLVNDIIRLSQIEEGVLPYAMAEVDLCRLAAEALDHIRPAAEARGISLSLTGEGITVYGAEPILYDVIYNLCDNAVKYNRENGALSVCIRAEDGTTTLSVSDTGIGIPPEHRDRIFERFYRVDKSHSKEIGGTGLGLSIVRHGAEYHGATVSVESAVDKGTTVSVVFPKEEIKNIL